MSHAGAEKGDQAGGGNTSYTILLAGDIMLARSVEARIDEAGVGYLFAETDGPIKGADLAIGNLECAVSERGSPVENKAYTFRARPESLEGVADAGFDAVVLANNHIGDFGPDAMNDTVENCESAGLVTSGLWYKDEGPGGRIPRPLLFPLDPGAPPAGPVVSHLSYAENIPPSFVSDGVKAGPMPLKYSVMEDDVAYARTVSDVVVVSIHWARMPQYVPEADEGQKEVCRRLVDAGADVVWCQGPHVLQECEGYGDGLILYSLGNYIFDLAEESSHQAALAVVTIAERMGARDTDDGAGEGGDARWMVDTLDLLPFRREDMRPVPFGGARSFIVGPDLWVGWDDYIAMFLAHGDWGAWGSGMSADGGAGSGGEGLDREDVANWLTTASMAGAAGLVIIISTVLLVRVLRRLRSRGRDGENR